MLSLLPLSTKVPADEPAGRWREQERKGRREPPWGSNASTTASLLMLLLLRLNEKSRSRKVIDPRAKRSRPSSPFRSQRQSPPIPHSACPVTRPRQLPPPARFSSLTSLELRLRQLECLISGQIASLPSLLSSSFSRSKPNAAADATAGAAGRPESIFCRVMPIQSDLEKTIEGRSSLERFLDGCACGLSPYSFSASRFPPRQTDQHAHAPLRPISFLNSIQSSPTSSSASPQISSISQVFLELKSMLTKAEEEVEGRSSEEAQRVVGRRRRSSVMQISVSTNDSFELVGGR
jgi:hypothetical protein